MPRIVSRCGSRMSFTSLLYSIEMATIILFAFPYAVNAQVIINEFSSSDSGDWIELYNTSSNEADLTPWLIKDTAASPVYEFSGNRLASGSSCYQSVSNRLNNSGDRIQLFNGITEVDCVAYGDGN